MKMIAPHEIIWCTRTSMEAPPKSYIKLKQEIAHMQCRISVEVKERARIKAISLNTSLNRLVEAALRYYCDELEKKK